MLIKAIVSTFEGIGYALLRLVPDSLLIPRIEAQVAKREAEANSALEDLGTLVARFERETKELKPLVEQKEGEIKVLLESGKQEAAASIIEEFETLETEYNEKKQAYEAGRADLEVRYKEANIHIEKLQKRLKAIKNNSARSKAEAKLNDLRKAVSAKRFDVGGLTDDLNLIEERIKERGDKVRGTSMVLDMETSKSASNVKVLEETQAASNQVRLARFAANRNIALATTQREAAPAPLGAATEEKAKA